MKLWHDDIRRPPDETWEWARTNAEARRLLALGIVEEASLDHDLGLDGMDPDEAHAAYLRGAGPETGLDLALWMSATGNVPRRVTIHSWNPDGAQRMAREIGPHCEELVIAPYQVAAP